MVEKLKEQIYIIPLGRVKRVPRWRRSAKAMKDIREFLCQHMKSTDVKLALSINETIWARGSQRPPARVRIKAMKFEDGQVKAELAE